MMRHYLKPEIGNELEEKLNVCLVHRYVDKLFPITFQHN